MENVQENSVTNEEIVDATIKELCDIFHNCDIDFVYDFVHCLFTTAELKDISNRWLLVKEIDNGTTQREIAKKFGMSLCKITRGSKELNKPDSAFRKILDAQAKS